MTLPVCLHASESPIITVRILHQTNIILNDWQAAMDLLEAKAPYYSDRPLCWMLKLAGREQAMFEISSEHPKFKVYRRLLTGSLNPRSVLRHMAAQQRERQTLLRGLAETPEDYVAHIRRYGFMVVL